MSDNRLVKPLERGMKILALLSKHGSLTLDQVASRTKIPRTSIFRLLYTLEVLEYVKREQVEGAFQYNLGLRVLSLAHGKLSRLNLRHEVRNIAEKLAKTTDEYVQLCVLDHHKVVYIDDVRRPKPLAIYGEVGIHLPINVSAPGMVLAAALDEEKRQQLLKEETFPKNTPKTLTDPNELKKVLKKVAEKGFVIDDEQYGIGIRCIAAPIFGHNGRVVAAINITGSVSTITDERIPALVGQVKAAAEEASKRMGYVLSSDNRPQSTKVKVSGMR